MYTATVSSKYQISIPKKLRDQMHIKSGQTFIFIMHGNSIELVPKRNLDDVRGSMSGANQTNVRDRKDRE